MTARQFFPALLELDDHGDTQDMQHFCSHPCRANYEHGGQADGKVYERHEMELPADKATCDFCGVPLRKDV